MTVAPAPNGVLRHFLAGSQWFERALLIEIFLACAVALTANSADPDLWGHVQYGRDALRDGLARTCTYSYTADGFRWINHENLAEYSFAFVSDTLGPLGLLFGKCVMGLLMIGLLIRHLLRQRSGLITVCIMSLLVAVSLSHHWRIRPQIFTYFFYTLVIALLSHCFQGWSGGWYLPRFWPPFSKSRPQLSYSAKRLQLLWLMPLMMVLATNAHGGFIAIFCVFAAYLVMRSWEALYCLGWSAWPLVAQFVAIVVVTALATLINPYGWEFHKWLYMDLSIPRPEILEWHRPDFASSYAIPLMLLLATWVACLLFSRKSHDATQLAVLGCCLLQTLEHLRHIPFLAIPLGFWFATHLESVLQRFQVSKSETTFGHDMSRAMRWVFAGCIVVASLLIGWKLQTRLTDLTVNRDEYPVQAFQYIADRKLQGKMVCTFNWAQYALAAFGPKAPGEKGILVHSDGRLRTSYPQEILDMQFDFILGNYPGMRNRSPQSPPCDGNRILEYQQPDLVLLDRGQEPAQNVMKANQDKWVLLYQDGLAQLWGRALKYANPHSSDFIPSERRKITDEPQTGTTSWPALPIAAATVAK